MVALTGWSTPSSVPSVGTISYRQQSIRYDNAYFIATGVDEWGEVSIRYATDAKGTWSAITPPAKPSGTTSVATNSAHRTWFDGTYYATVVQYTDFSTVNKARVLYATSLGGTWTSYEFDTSDNYRPRDIAYIDGQWVMVGTYFGSNPRKPFIATCSTPMGTWSFDTTASGTGLDTSGLGTGDGYQIIGIDHDGTNYVYAWYQIAGSQASGLKTSTSLSSGWAAPSSYLSSSTYTQYTTPALAYVNGYWFNGVWLNSSGKPYLQYAQDPTGTWDYLTPTQLGMDTLLYYADGVSFDGTNYITVGGATTNRRAGYYASTTSPNGTYTQVTTGLASSQVVDVIYVDPIHVALQLNGAIRYSNDIPYIPPPTPTAFTLLRQRQSPLRTPARVRGVDLRQRQTPYIT